MVKKLLLAVSIISMASSCIAVPGLFTERTLEEKGYTNSLGMKMLRIEPGSSEMGSMFGRDFWDEQPDHKVKKTPA